MAKVKHSVATHRRKKRLLKKAKGYKLDRSKQYQQARRTYARALVYAYRDRRNKKRMFRRLWIARLNAACRAAGLTYNKFIHGLKLAQVNLDRKVLAEIAVSDQTAFQKLVALVKAG